MYSYVLCNIFLKAQSCKYNPEYEAQYGIDAINYAGEYFLAR